MLGLQSIPLIGDHVGIGENPRDKWPSEEIESQSGLGWNRPQQYVVPTPLWRGKGHFPLNRIAQQSQSSGQWQLYVVLSDRAQPGKQKTLLGSMESHGVAFLNYWHEITGLWLCVHREQSHPLGWLLGAAAGQSQTAPGDFERSSSSLKCLCTLSLLVRQQTWPSIKIKLLL